MKAAVYDRYGDPSVFRIAEMKEPQMKPDEVLVEVKASSVNPVDWKIRKGNLRIISGFKFPKFAGSDFSGVVKASNIPGYKPGDKVYGMLNSFKGGAFAQLLTAKAGNICLQPSNLDFHEAAAIPLAGLTSLQTMKYKGKIKPGHHVLINACCGGVGHLAVQYCKARMAKVTGICSSSKVETAYQLGADRVIDYQKGDIYAGENEYDIVLDPIGNIDFSQMKKQMAENGIMISFGRSLSKAATALYSIFLEKKLKFFLTIPSHEDLLELKGLIEQDKIRPLIHRIFPLSQVAEANEESENGHAIGKIVVSVK